ncbi:LLM class flavin-dependent oxidoreductase [Nocardia carnea]|uniref:LLM class flavin-dependent oxidoreductase n=1 Tax=Nocardia carnea TaxID=37328 RepID=UPI0024548520|nr:LLM class flavin-dependent oxidoreductase [Nocardia carnea]
MDLNCNFPPTVSTPDHIALAEELGYSRAFVFDSPALCADAPSTVALAAARTSRIKLGIAVITPHVRHLIANASVIAHLATLAPGRVEIGIGTGFTSAALLGRKPARWSEIERYVIALRELLAGREVEWDGQVLGLLHGPASGVCLPVEVPVWVAAEGPMGWATADRLGAGVIANPSHGHNAETHEQSVTMPRVVGPMLASNAGTVLEDDETVESPRVLAAAGPIAALSFHFGDRGPLACTPELAGHLAAISEVDESRRHLVLHRGHLMEVNDTDQKFLTPDVIRRASTTMTRSGWAEYLSAIEAAGASGFLYNPAGPDIPREIRAMQEAMSLVAKS